MLALDLRVFPAEVVKACPTQQVILGSDIACARVRLGLSVCATWCSSDGLVEARSRVPSVIEVFRRVRMALGRQ